MTDTDRHLRDTEGLLVLQAYREAYETETGRPCPPLSLREIESISGIPRTNLHYVESLALRRLRRQLGALDQPNTLPIDPDMEIPAIEPGAEIRNVTPGSVYTILEVSDSFVTVRTVTGKHTHRREVFDRLFRKLLEDGATYHSLR